MSCLSAHISLNTIVRRLSTGAHQTLTERLEELNVLRDRHVITPDEYVKARMAALGIDEK